MEEFTVKEYAAKERVHELTVRRWIRDGALPYRRTVGGQIRIPSPESSGRRVLVLQTEPDART